MLDLFSSELERLKLKNSSAPSMNVGDEQIETRFGNVFYPTVVRAKGSSQVVTNQSSRRKRIQTCRQCGGTGHNKRSCMFADRRAHV